MEEAIVTLAQAVMDIKQRLSDEFKRTSVPPDKHYVSYAVDEATEKWGIPEDGRWILMEIYFKRHEEQIIRPGINWAYFVLKNRNLL